MRREIKCFDESYYTIKDDGCVGTTNTHIFFVLTHHPFLLPLPFIRCYYFKTEKKRDLTGVFVTCQHVPFFVSGKA